MNQTDFLQIGQQKGYIQLLNDEKRIHYVVPDKKYRFTDPEEKVRAKFYGISRFGLEKFSIYPDSIRSVRNLAKMFVPL